MSYHTTTPKILNTLILSLMLVPTKTHATTLDLFLTFLAHQKSFCQDFSHSVFLIKICFYLFTTPKIKIKIKPHFLIIVPSLITQLPFYHTTTPCLHFLSMSQISSSSSHLFASPKSPCQSPSKNLIHRSFKAFSLGCKNYIPSQQLTPFVTTCRATKTHQKQKHIKNRLFYFIFFLASLKHYVTNSPTAI